MMILLYDPQCASYRQLGHPEKPERVTRTVDYLKTHHPEWIWQVPSMAAEETVRRAHTSEHIQMVMGAAQDFDADTPTYPQIGFHALRSVGAACQAAELAMKGEKAFSLMRPPGHHATRNQAMGFCYFNSIAIAALEIVHQGVERVGIWDFDAHHGNGTEDIVRGNPALRFSSVHQVPGYPWTGLESFDNIYNHPIPPRTFRDQHLEVLKKSLDEILDFNSQLILVSAGFDAYQRDPLTQMSLEEEDFRLLGKWLSETGRPTAAILEGGYSPDLCRLIAVFLEGWSQ